MTTFTTKLFGIFSVPADGRYEAAECVVGGRRLARSLFISEAFDDGLVPRITAMLDTLDELDARARRAIADDPSKTVPDYIAFHVEEVAELAGLGSEAFLEKLELVGVGVHPEGAEDFYVVLDYSPGRQLTDGVLAVKLDSKGELLEVSHES